MTRDAYLALSEDERMAERVRALSNVVGGRASAVRRFSTPDVVPQPTSGDRSSNEDLKSTGASGLDDVASNDVLDSRSEGIEPDVGRLRRKLRLTQKQFAVDLGVSVNIVRSWEAGRSTPAGPALALLKVIEEYPQIFEARGKAQANIAHDAEQQKSVRRDSRRSRIDVHVGQRVLQRRWMIGLTQEQLGERAGVTWRRIQKFETGAERISATDLWDLAAVLEVPVSFFFEGIGGGVDESGMTRGDVLTDKEALELVRAYYAIPEADRRRLFDLARTLSDVA